MIVSRAVAYLSFINCYYCDHGITRYHSCRFYFLLNVIERSEFIYLNVIMNEIIKRKKLENQRNIVQVLTYDVFRLIFKYLDNETVYNIIRRVCHKLRRYVESYMKPIEIYLSSSGKELPNQIHYYFISGNGTKIVCDNLVRHHVEVSSDIKTNVIRPFGAVYSDKIELVIGDCSKDIQKHFIKEQLESNIITYVTFTPYKFDPLKNGWNLIERDSLEDLIKGQAEFCIHFDGTALVLSFRNELPLCNRTKSYDSKCTSNLLLLRAQHGENYRKETMQFLIGPKISLLTSTGSAKQIPEEPNRLFIRLR